ncbi:MAG: PAS domain S-box protein [Crenarchaeota archaeon]|nr:PAS domain S-box protein [Thermoproteota archaeon]
MSDCVTHSSNSQTHSIVRVLLVDDDVSVLDISKEILFDMGKFDIDCASSVDEAFLKIKDKKYSVIVSDYEMPQKNGLTFLKELKEQKIKIPFILFTGKGREEVIINALNLGVDYYINKQGSPESVYGELVYGINLLAERKKVEVELEQKRQILEHVTANVNVGLSLIDKNYNIVWTNRVMENIVGPATGKICYSTFNTLNQVCPDCGVKKIFDGSNFDVHQFQGFNKNGDPYWLDLVATAIKDDQGKTTAALEMSINITEHKKTALKIQQQNKVLMGVNKIFKEALSTNSEAELGRLCLSVAEEITESKFGFIGEIKPNGFEDIALSNPGWTACQVIDAGGHRRQPGIHTIHGVYGRVLSDGKSLLTNDPSSHPDSIGLPGGHPPLSCFLGVPLKFDGKTIGMVGLGNREGGYSKTEQQMLEELAPAIVEALMRKRAEDDLRLSEEKYQVSFNASMDALMLVNENGFFDCNKATLSLFGIKTVEEFIKYSPAKLSPPKQPDGSSSKHSSLEHIRKAFETGEDRFFWVHKRLDGAQFLADVLLTRLRMKEKTVLQATVRDVTIEKEAQDRLKETEEMYRTLLNDANVLIQSIDAHGKFLFVNDKWKNALYYTEDDLVTLNVVDIIKENNRSDFKTILKKVYLGKSISDFETVLVTKTGQEIIVNGKVCPLIKNGTVISIFGFFVDITDRKKAEVALNESMNTLIFINEKLNVVGSLTRHDVRNKLSIVSAVSYLLKKQYPTDPKIVDAINKIEKAVAGSVEIFDFAKMYEQMGVEKLKYIDVNETLFEAFSLFPDFGFELVNGCGGLFLLADSFLRQLFYNFIDNTCKYGQKATTIKVTFKKDVHATLKLIYEDDGVGISLKNKGYLFKQGFSTGNSSGFGLFLTKKMMDVYGWSIAEAGKPGAGVKFVITIPKFNKNGKPNYKITK